MRGRALYRTADLHPDGAVGGARSASVWRLILSPLWGIARDLLAVVGLETLYQPWLGLEGSALVGVSLISVWQYVGIPMLLSPTRR